MSADVFLDLLSTSQKISLDIEFELEQSRLIQAKRCEKNAPFIFYRDAGGKGHITQGCCNNWTCARCGHIRAREEYGRMVEGAKTLSDDGRKLYFWTITCRGRELSHEEAEQNYLLWTNRLFSSARAKAKKQNSHWCYVAVTERQKRGHPHSHVISSFAPDDAKAFEAGQLLPNGRRAKHDCLWSEWFRDANVKAGLGQECDISEIRNPITVAVYVAKYLFKDAINTQWPAGWKRVRYSQNWTKLPERKSEEAFPIITMKDWLKVAAMPERIYAADDIAYEAALARLVTNVMPPVTV